MHALIYPACVRARGNEKKMPEILGEAKKTRKTGPGIGELGKTSLSLASQQAKRRILKIARFLPFST